MYKMATIFDNQYSFPNTQIEKEICSYIEELIQKDNNITPREVYNLLSEKFIEPDADEYPFDFTFASWLDNKYFGLGGGFWLSAYSRPKEFDIIKIDEVEYVAIDCGIFTFNMVDNEKAKKSYINEIDKFIDTKLISNPEIQPYEMYYMIQEHFSDTHKYIKNLDFNEASDIDNINYGTGGCFWRQAYGLPKENDEIQIDDTKYVAKNVGIFTFDLF
jgi:hypothetical protein